MAICAAVVAGLVTLALLLKPLFRDRDGFQECLDLVFKSNVASILDDWGENLWAELKFGAWVGSGGIVGLAAYFGLEKFFG